MTVNSVNKAIILGNVGRDPEIKNTQEGKEIAILSVATSEGWKDKKTDVRKEKTEWHKVVIFIPALIEVVRKYVKKGTKVYIEGSIQTRKWQDSANVEKYVTEILLQSFNSVFVIVDNKVASGNDHGESGDFSSDFSSNNTGNFSSNNTQKLDDELNDDDNLLSFSSL